MGIRNDNFEGNKFTGHSIQIEKVQIVNNLLNRKTLAFFVVATTLPFTSYASEYDIVNGQFVKKDDQATGVMAGVPIRYPVENKSRFVEATQKQWQDRLLVDDASISPRKI